MSELLSVLKQLGTAFIAFVAYTMGSRDNAAKQKLAQKEAELVAANKVLIGSKKYEKLKTLAPDSWDTIKRLPDDTKNKVSSSAKTKLP